MEMNPYQTPKADLESEAVFKRSVLWKIYFFFITILSGLGMASFLADPNAGISEYVDAVLWVIATIGFYGFVFLKPIYIPSFWLYVFVTYIVFSVSYYFITDIDLRMGMSDTGFYVSSAIGWLLSLPAYYGLYAFSKPGYPVWKNA